MYHHLIQEMTSALVEAGLTTDEKQVEHVLAKYWADKVAIVWTTEDVHGIQEDFDKDKQRSSLSDEQAQEILLSAFENHDCNYGITWDSLHYWSKEVLEQEVVSAPSWEEEQNHVPTGNPRSASATRNSKQKYNY